MFKILAIIGVVILIIFAIKIIKSYRTEFKTNKNTKENEKQEEQIEFRDATIAFLKSKEYKYLANFAKLHKNNYKYFIEEKELDNDENINKKIIKLKKLLEKRGFIFNIRQLKLLIYDEIIFQTYEDFKSKILYYKPNNLKKYIKAFLYVYGEDYKEFINYYHFKILLSEKGIEYNEYTLKDELNALRKDLEL